MHATRFAARLVAFLLVGLGIDCAAPAATPQLREAEIVAVDWAAGTVQVAGRTIDDGTRLALFAAGQPLGWFEHVEPGNGAVVFQRATPLAEPTGAPHAWLVPRELTGELWPQWPAGVALWATVQSVGPGGRGLWVAAGARDGVTDESSWWYRVFGQPAVRLDVLSVEADACYCAVLPLAADVQLRVGDRVALWPDPGERRRNTAVSAVAFVDQPESKCLVWVAAPPGVVLPAEPHVDFYHRQTYLGHGIVEATDDLFWYVRLLTSSAAPVVTTSASPPTSAPVGPGAAAPNACPVRVGDRVVPRTQADVDQRRFVARISDVTPDGPLLNAGEVEGLKSEEIGALWRGGAPIGSIRIVRVQRGYSIVAPAPGELQTIQVGDEVRFAAGEPPAVAVAEITQTADGTIFAARGLGTRVPLRTPLVAQSGGQPIGLALVLSHDGEGYSGFVLEATATRPLRPGDQLLRAEPGD